MNIFALDEKQIYRLHSMLIGLGKQNSTSGRAEWCYESDGV